MVGGDDDAGVLVEPAQQMEEQSSTWGTKRQVADLVEESEWASLPAICPERPWMTRTPEGIVSFDIGCGFIDEHQGCAGLEGTRQCAMPAPQPLSARYRSARCSAALSLSTGDRPTQPAPAR